jgi:hypothetical protein
MTPTKRALSISASLFTGGLGFAFALVALPLSSSCAMVDISYDSPFLPASGPSSSSGQAPSVLEYHGVVTMEGETYFNVQDMAAKKSAWVKLNQPGRDYVVKNRDLSGGDDSITVEYQGRSLRLPFIKSKTGKAPSPVLALAAAQAAVAARPGPPPDGPISPVILNPTSADEQRRLEDFRAEVLRRRSLRQQSQQVPQAQQQSVQQTSAQPAQQQAQPRVRRQQ